MRIKHHGGTLAGASSPLKVTTSLKDRESPVKDASPPQHEVTPSQQREQENLTASDDAVTPGETLPQAPYSPTSNPFGVRPRTRTPAGSLAAARRDSGGLPVSIPPLPAEGGAHADPGHIPPSSARRQLPLTMPLTPPGAGTGASSPAAPSPGFSEMGGFSGDEEAQSWLTSPEVRPADAEAAWEAAGRLTELYDEALLHTMRTAQSRAGQSMDELPARERSVESDVIPEAPGSGGLQTLAEDEELEDDGTGLIGRLPLADFGDGPSPLAYPTRLQSPSSGMFAYAPGPPAFVLSPEDQLERSIGDAERIRERLVADGADVRASLEAAAAGIRALAAAGAGPATPAANQVTGGAFASPISTTDSPAPAVAPAPALGSPPSGGRWRRSSTMRELGAATLRAFLVAAVLAAAVGLAGVLPPLHGWGRPSAAPAGRAVFPHTAAQSWAGAKQAAAHVPLAAGWLPTPQPASPPQPQPRPQAARPHTMAQHLRQHAGALWHTVQGSVGAAPNAPDAEAAIVTPPPPPPQQAAAAARAPAAEGAAGRDPSLAARLLQSLSSTLAPPPEAVQPQAPAHDQDGSAAAAREGPAAHAARISVEQEAAPAAEAGAGPTPAAGPATPAPLNAPPVAPAAGTPATAKLAAAKPLSAGPDTKPHAAAAAAAAGQAAAPAAAPAAAKVVAKPSAAATAPASWSAVEAAARRVIAPAASHGETAAQQPRLAAATSGDINWAAAAALACTAAFAAVLISLLWRGYVATLAPPESPAAAHAAAQADEVWDAVNAVEPTEDAGHDVISSPAPNGTPSALPPLPTFGAPSTRRSTRARPATQSAPAAAAPVARRHPARRLSAAPSASLQSGHVADESAPLEATAEGPASPSVSGLASRGVSRLVSRGTAAAVTASVGRATRSVSRRLSAAVSGMAAGADADEGEPGVDSQLTLNPRAGATTTRRSHARQA